MRARLKYSSTMISAKENFMLENKNDHAQWRWTFYPLYWYKSECWSWKGKRVQSLSNYQKYKAIISFESIGTSREDEGFAHLEKHCRLRSELISAILNHPSSFMVSYYLSVVFLSK